MARRKTTRRKTGTTAKKRTTAKRRTTGKKKSGGIVNFFVPLFFIGCILFCLGFLMFMGYRTATASSFFEFEKVEMYGVKNVSKDEVKKIVKSYTIEEGVWNADIGAIKREIKNFNYAKEVSVSRVLPDAVRVIVEERIPRAMVRLDGEDFWVDEEGLVLSRVSAKDEQLPFTMFGWSEKDTEKAQENNKKRVALYAGLLEEWNSFNLSEQVKAVDLSDLKDVHAIVEGPRRSVEVRIGDESFGKRLQKGIEAINASNGCIGYVITSGDRIVKGPCDS